MEDTEKMLIERECERLVTQYCHFVDHDEATRIADLFAEDGVCDLTQVSWTGRDRIRKGFQGRENNKKRMSRHVCNNLLIDVISPTEAVGRFTLPFSSTMGNLGVRLHRLTVSRNWESTRIVL